jgi:hypothetical protein
VACCLDPGRRGGGLSLARFVSSPHKELASISGPAIERSIVSEILWDGGTLLIQTVAMDPAGEMSARYYTVPGPRMEVRRLAEARSGAERYWRMKASRIRPTGLGQITNRSDAKMPMSRD